MTSRQRRIADAVLQLFAEQGSSFSVDDVAQLLKMSKKTIYKEYRSKEELICLVLDAVLESIAHRLENIMADDSSSVVEKLIRVSAAFPDTEEIDYKQALALKSDFPAAYGRFIEYIESHWELNKRLFLQAVQEGALEPVEFDLFKLMVLGISKEVLDSEGENKEELLESAIRRLFRGLEKRG